MWTSTAASYTACWICPPNCITPIFAMARIVGWSAHRIEELSNGGKIIRPAYKSIAKHREYTRLGDRS